MWLNKRYPCLYSLSTTTIWHLSMDKDTFMENCEISIKCQWIEDFIPIMHWIIVLTMAPAVDCKSALTLGHSLEAPEKHYLKQPWQMLEQSWKFRPHGQVSGTMLKEIKMSLDTCKRVEAHLCFTHIVPLWTAQLSAKKPSWFMILLRGKVRKYEWESSFLSCVGGFQRGLFISHLIQSTK